MKEIVQQISDVLKSVEKSDLVLTVVNTFATIVSSMFITIVSLIVGATASRMNLFNKLAGKIVNLHIVDNTYKYSNSEKVYLMADLNIVNKTDSPIYIDNLTISMDKKDYQINTVWNAQEPYRFDKIKIDRDEPVVINLPFNDDLLRNFKELSFSERASSIWVKLKNSNRIVASKKLDKRYVGAWNLLIETTNS